MAAERDELDDETDEQVDEADEAPAERPKRDAKGHFIRAEGSAGYVKPRRPRGRPRGSRTRHKAETLDGGEPSAPKPRPKASGKGPFDVLASVWESMGKVIAGGLVLLSHSAFGERNGLTLNEATCIIQPAGRMLGRRLPTVKIAANLDGPDRADLELMVATGLEYVSRLVAQALELAILKQQAAARARAQAAAQRAPGPASFVESTPPQGAEVPDETEAAAPQGRSEQEPSMARYATVFPSDYGMADGG